MIPIKRHGLILDFLRANGAASVPELEAQTGASAPTIRRDLIFLEQQGLLERSRGGAVLNDNFGTAFEPNVSVASHVASAQKQAIGLRAADEVREGDSVLFDSSSTVLEAAREVARRDLAITAATNDLAVAQVFAQRPRVSTLVLGGKLRPGSNTLHGAPGDSFLAGLHADVAFIGVHAITEAVMSEASLEVAEMKAQMIRSCRRAIVLADSSKFRSRAFAEIGRLDLVSDLVTDSDAPEAQLRRLRESGVSVTVCDYG